MNELFQEPLFGELDRWFGDFSSARFQPRIDVVDDGKALRITAELPGMNREDIQTSLEAGALVIRGEKKQDKRTEEDGCYRLERAHGAFMRRIPLPDGVDAEHIDARFDNGVLTLNLPKTGTSASAARNIEIRQECPDKFQGGNPHDGPVAQSCLADLENRFLALIPGADFVLRQEKNMAFDSEWLTLGKHRVRLHSTRGFPTDTLRIMHADHRINRPAGIGQ